MGECYERHRQQEFVKFLATIDERYPAEPAQEIHLVMDDNATHKTDRVRRWLVRRPRCHVHYTPTSASWLS